MRQNLENMLFPYCLLPDSGSGRLWILLVCWLLNVFGLYCLKLPSDWKLKIIMILQITNTEEIKLCLHEANAPVEIVM